jgi:hypothetical protein
MKDEKGAFHSSFILPTAARNKNREALASPAAFLFQTSCEFATVESL